MWLRQLWYAGNYETLDALFRRDVRRLPVIMDFVRYPYNPAVQAEAIRITQFLAERIPNIVDMLIQPAAGRAARCQVCLQCGSPASADIYDH
jgi:hypothetical protein